MQNSALPDLAHTRPRAVHWLATAAATAAVVALAGLLQPTAATATGATPQHTADGRPDTLPPAPGPTRAGEPVAAPDATAATYPLKCRGGSTTVVKQASGDLDGDHRPETVAAVRCRSGFGTPPTGIYVLTSPQRVVATLLDPADQQNVTELTVTGGTVTATLLGYSSENVARCCPDTRGTHKWQWRNGTFTRSATTDARGV
ncbi:hypothetical protein ACIQM4_30795 [Streptomyces sp. NPDC091272]|uniref:hypothetical protein n=1 Tax=Streptomyces sp. NPDC091272 TaxID=3365981 RepID=UPI00380256D6